MRERKAFRIRGSIRLNAISNESRPIDVVEFIGGDDLDIGHEEGGVETLDLAVDALETLQGRGQKVGVITSRMWPP